MPAILDASALIALGAREDPGHDAMRSAVAAEVSAIVVPQPLLCDAAYVIREREGPPAVPPFIRLLAGSSWRIEPADTDDLQRAADLFEQYADTRLDLIDSLTVAIAERLRASRIYTLDRRDFSIVRPRQVEAFELLP
jgi:predicted nucleic acid-binding protein